MTTETVQDVLREMRRIAAIQPQEFADRIERALAVDDAMVRRAIKSSGIADADWHTGRILWPHNQHREAVMNAARADLTAALIDSAQDGKGE